MKKLLHILFDKGNENQKWYHVIFWWEIRRIPYNIIMLLSALFSFLVFNFVVKGAWDFLPPPFALIFVGFLANVFYTLGWFIELGIKSFSPQKANVFGKMAFKAGIIFSLFCVFAPALTFTIEGIIKGERASSPYSHFATDKPESSEIVGEYHLDTASLKLLEPNDRGLVEKTVLNLNSDGTFVFDNLPIFGLFDDYCITNGKGKWKIEKHFSFDTWALSMNFDPFQSSINCRKQRPRWEYPPNFRKAGFLTDYFIYNNKPPYAIYVIIGDPDSWEGLKFNKMNQ